MKDKCLGSGREATHSDGSYKWFCPICGFAPRVSSMYSYTILRPHRNRVTIARATMAAEPDKIVKDSS